MRACIPATCPPPSGTVDPRTIIERQRIARGFRTHAALASAAGIPQPTLSRYMSGKHAWLDMQHFISLAHALHVTVSELIGESPMANDDTRDILAELAHMTREELQRLRRVIAAVRGD